MLEHSDVTAVSSAAEIWRQRMIDEGWRQTMASYYHEKSIPYCIEHRKPLPPLTHTHAHTNTHAHTHKLLLEKVTLT